tara:strand:- start:103 stop:786 length:684 start_codon:yes stop_codon:yes gene_type:complete
MRWEVADIGILVVFRRNKMVERSKVVLLQAKRLYSDKGLTVETNPLNDRLGFNDMFIDDALWAKLSDPQTFSFSDNSLYRALEIADEQYEAIQRYEQKHKIPVHYLFYNPPTLPMSTAFPITSNHESDIECALGCRVVPSKQLRKMVSKQTIERPPSFGELRTHLGKPFDNDDNLGGWRLESYIVDQLIACKDGLVDTSPKYQHLGHIFSQKQRPISSAITITFDMP